MSGPWEDYADKPNTAEAAPWDEYATDKPKVKTVKELPKTTIMQDVKQGAGNIGAGLIRGAGSIGATLMYPWDKANDIVRGDRGPNLESLITGKQPLSRNEERRQAMDWSLGDMGAETDSYGYKGGKIAGEIAGTAGAGGAVGNLALRAAPTLARVGMSAPAVADLATALSSGGFRAGSATGLKGLALRGAAGATVGGISAGMADPKNIGTGAVVGALLPPGLKVLGGAAGHAGKTVKSLVQPFTAKGQESIAGNVIRKFADGGPTVVNNAQIIPGSVPTLAEATGNAGLATLQRGARDLNPNAFVMREQANAAARNSVFDDIAGDAGKLDFFKAERASVGKQLYDDALNVVPAAPTPYLKGQITQLLKRPSINAASRDAQKMALERGDKPYMNGSMKGLHDTKTALDDMINEAVIAGKGGHAKALGATKDKLVDVMEKLSPGYKEANLTYAKMSQPVNAMEALQGLRITDAQGNITLSRVKNAIEGLERAKSANGFNAAKSIEPQQMEALKAIHADLLRQSAVNAGKSAGSNTFQNLATDNILNTMLPGKLGSMMHGRLGTVAGHVGNLAYKGSNERIKNTLVEMMLDPARAQGAFAAPQVNSSLELLNSILNRSAPVISRTAPLLSSDQK